MLEKDKALRVEKIFYGKNLRSGKMRSQKVYFYRCHCGAEIRSQASHLKKHSGKCVSCAQFNDPYKAAYNELVKNCGRRNIHLTIKYEDFLNFTKIDKCHYCYGLISWKPHTKHKGSIVDGSRSYKLDRMNNDVGYNLENCVVCCWKCNSAKGNRYTYNEWFQMTSIFRKDE